MSDACKARRAAAASIIGSPGNPSAMAMASAVPEPPSERVAVATETARSRSAQHNHLLDSYIVSPGTL